MRYSAKQRGEVYADVLQMYLDNPVLREGVCYFLGQTLPKGYCGTNDEEIEATFPEWFEQEKNKTQAKLYWWPQDVWKSGNALRVEALLCAIDSLQSSKP